MKIFREPLIQFLLLGAVIFAAHSLFFKTRASGPREIVVTSGIIENLASTFARSWQRPPTEQELSGLIQDYIREEIAYREALTMGLDRDDTIIRRRLRQKLEFVSEEILQQQPTDAELQTYLNSHSADYRADDSFTFRQLCLDPQKRGAKLREDAARMIQELKKIPAGGDISSFGDYRMLDTDYKNISSSDVKRVFGESFAISLPSLKSGEWQGPIQSGYGMHLVFVSSRTEGNVPELQQIRDAVQRDWLNAKRLEQNEKFYQALMKQYEIRIEQPELKKIAESGH